MDMVTLALQRTNGRVLKRSRRRDFVHGGDGQEQDGTGNTGVHGEYIYIYSAIRRPSKHAYGCVIKLKRCAWNQFHIRRNSHRSLTG